MTTSIDHVVILLVFRVVRLQPERLADFPPRTLGVAQVVRGSAEMEVVLCNVWIEGERTLEVLERPAAVCPALFEVRNSPLVESEGVILIELDRLGKRID